MKAKYRVIYKKGKYHAQTRFLFFFWASLGVEICETWSPHKYDTKEEAMAAIKEMENIDKKEAKTKNDFKIIYEK